MVRQQIIGSFEKILFVRRASKGKGGLLLNQTAYWLVGILACWYTRLQFHVLKISQEQRINEARSSSRHDWHESSDLENPDISTRTIDWVGS